MPKWTNDLAMDAALDYIAGSTVMHVCGTLDATPTLAEVAAASLASVAMTGGDFAKSDGTTSGRKTTVAAKNGISVTVSGTANHIALVDGTVVREVTTCTSQALTSGNTVNVPAWTHEIGDPT